MKKTGTLQLCDNLLVLTIQCYNVENHQTKNGCSGLRIASVTQTDTEPQRPMAPHLTDGHIVTHTPR